MPAAHVLFLASPYRSEFEGEPRTLFLGCGLWIYQAPVRGAALELRIEHNGVLVARVEDTPWYEARLPHDPQPELTACQLGWIERWPTAVWGLLSGALPPGVPDAEVWWAAMNNRLQVESCLESVRLQVADMAGRLARPLGV